ncbi:hypothetical protein [Streptomyces sp. NPDC001774]
MRMTRLAGAAAAAAFMAVAVTGGAGMAQAQAGESPGSPLQTQACAVTPQTQTTYGDYVLTNMRENSPTDRPYRLAWLSGEPHLCTGGVYFLYDVNKGSVVPLDMGGAVSTDQWHRVAIRIDKGTHTIEVRYGSPYDPLHSAFLGSVSRMDS